jgi:hypothetical protein
VESRSVEAFISRGGAVPALFKADIEPPVIEIPAFPFREARRLVAIKRREKEKTEEVKAMLYEKRRKDA